MANLALVGSDFYKPSSLTNKNIKVISISGKANSGKGVVSSTIKAMYQGQGYKVIEINLADYLKFVLEKYFGFGLEKYTKEELRMFYQVYGTEVMRAINSDFHIDLLSSTINGSYQFNKDYLNGDDKMVFVCSDTRFDNEVDLLRRRFNTTFINVVRDGEFTTLSNDELQHASENGLNNVEFDYVVENDSGYGEFLNKIEKLCDNLLYGGIDNDL